MFINEVIMVLNLLVIVVDGWIVSIDIGSSVVGSSILGIVMFFEGGSGRDDRESSKSSEDSFGEYFCCLCCWCVYCSIDSECWYVWYRFFFCLGWCWLVVVKELKDF